VTEQDAMARLAAANPVPDAVVAGQAASSQARFLLRAVLARPPVEPGRPRSRPARRIALAAAGLVLIAGGGTAVVRALAGDRVPAPPPSPVAAPSVVFTTAAVLAQRTEQPGQFVHTGGTVGRIVHVDSAGGYDLIRVDSVQSVQPAAGLPGEGWLAVGDQGSSVRPLSARDAAAYRADGAPGADRLPRSTELRPDLAGDPRFDGAVADLPGDPAGAATAMIEQAATGDGFDLGGVRSPVPPDAQGWLFRECTRLLDTFTGVLGGADRAKLFRVLAGLTGVRTLPGSTDPLGRPASGLAYTAATSRYGVIDWQIFLAAGTDRIGFTQAVVRQPGPANSTLLPGAVQYSTAVTSVTRSDKP
jgi:hypothetical protein